MLIEDDPHGPGKRLAIGVSCCERQIDGASPWDVEACHQQLKMHELAQQRRSHDLVGASRLDFLELHRDDRAIPLGMKWHVAGLCSRLQRGSQAISAQIRLLDGLGRRNPSQARAPRRHGAGKDRPATVDSCLSNHTSPPIAMQEMRAMRPVKCAMCEDPTEAAKALLFKGKLGDALDRLTPRARQAELAPPEPDSR